jgi:hypothetical protein
MQGSSSRREGAKIAQGETLGKRFTEEFPPCRGGVRLRAVAGFKYPWR